MDSTAAFASSHRESSPTTGTTKERIGKSLSALLSLTVLMWDLKGARERIIYKYPLFDIAKLNDSCYNALEVYSESEISP
jgi:hypothetical protein